MEVIERAFVVPDIHGEDRKLDRLIQRLDAIDRDKQAVLIFLGDYLDGDPEGSPRGVIETLLRVRQERRCVFLRGNHEQMCLDFIAGDKDRWTSFGASTTLRSYGIPLDVVPGSPVLCNDIPQKHMDFLTSLEHYHLVSIGGTRYLFVHAGRVPDLHIELHEGHPDREKRTSIIEGYHAFWARPDDGEWPESDVVVFGHAAQDEPVFLPSRGSFNRICIDTGYRSADRVPVTRPLTALELPSTDFHPVW